MKKLSEQATNEDIWTDEERENIVGFFDLLLKIDKRYNSEESVKSQDDEVSEVSELSMRSVEGYDETVSVEGNEAIVKKKEKFLGIFNTEIESRVILDDEGNVIDEKKSFFNWLRSIFSF